MVKICPRCKEEFATQWARQKFCPGCASINKKEYGAQWRKNHVGYKSPQPHKKRICPQCGREYRTKKNQQEYCPACIAEAQELSLGHFPLPRDNWRKEYLPIPLNQPFLGCEGHHIDKTHIVYIPKELHRSVPHDLWSGENMVGINSLALEYLQRKP